jgi:magnesium-transporting ATPase (P-type)
MTFPPETDGHALPPEAATEELRIAVATGLTRADARARLATHGPNHLAEKPARPVWRKFLDQFRSLLVLILLGAAILVGTLGVYAWAMQAGDAVGNDARAMTLAFTTFVLFQFFNIFNARAEHGSAFNAQLFSNGKLWLALFAVVTLQAVAVHWGPAQAIFDTVDLTSTEWAIAVAVASSTLFLEEARKLLLQLFNRPTNG